MNTANDLAALHAETHPDEDLLDFVSAFINKDRARLRYLPEENLLFLMARPEVLAAAAAEAEATGDEDLGELWLGRQVSGEMIELMLRTLAVDA